MRGRHCLRTYSVTQKFVTLSSGEAELMAVVRASSEAIGMAQLAQGWGMSLDAEIFVDSSAALAVTARRGNGKLRHVKVGHLWIQELAAREEVAYRKVAGETNPADLCTKHLPAPARERLLPMLGVRPASGRASAGISLDACQSFVGPYGGVPWVRGGVLNSDLPPICTCPCACGRTSATS